MAYAREGWPWHWARVTGPPVTYTHKTRFPPLRFTTQQRPLRPRPTHNHHPFIKLHKRSRDLRRMLSPLPSSLRRLELFSLARHERYASGTHTPGLPPRTHRQPRGWLEELVELSGASTTWLDCHTPLLGGRLAGTSVPPSYA